MSQAITQRSFSAGEIAPSFAARADYAKYAQALRTCRNFLVQKHGGVTNRPGFAHIDYVKQGVAYRVAAAALSPTNYWKLQETNGTVAFDAGSGADPGTIGGTPTQGVWGPMGLALRFDGTDDEVALTGVAATTGTWSLAFWFRPNTAAGAATYQGILQDATPLGVFFKKSTLRITTLSTFGEAANTTALVTGTWYHIALTVAANVVTFYVNGVADGTGTMDSSVTPATISQAGERLAGDLSDVLYIVGTAITPTQIAALYAARVDTVVQIEQYLADDPNESILVEVGYKYLRFYKDGAQVQVLHSAVTAWSNATAYTVGDLADIGGIVYYCILAHTNQQPPNATYWYPFENADATTAIYEVQTPWTGGVYWDQAGQVVTLTQQGFAPRELIYLSLTRWVLQTISFTPTGTTPTNIVATAGTAGTVADNMAYQVTSARVSTFEESLPGTSNRIQAAMPTSAAANLLEWDVDANAAEFYVYRDSTKSSTFEFIGTCKPNTRGSGGKVFFLDTGFTQDPAITPPINDLVLDTTNNQPAVSASHQQRRFFANTITVPDGIWGSRVGQRANFTRSSPLQDDDSLSFRIVQRNNHAIRHLVSVAAGLITFTGAGEHRVVAGDGPNGPLTPNSLNPIQDLYAGAAADAKPVVSGNSVIFVQARGKIARDVQYDEAIAGLAGRDLTLLAGHLFEGYTLIDLDYQQNDHSIVWFVRSDGTLLGLTYIREQDVWGWHRHDSSTEAGASDFEDVCVVPEDHEDVLYVVVARTVNGFTFRFIERLETRIITDFDAQSIFLDASLSRLSGSPTATVSGLDHLEGETVGVVADGAYLGTATVTSGSVTLPDSATGTVIHIGLLYQSDLETLDLDIADSDVRSQKKKVGQVSLLVQDSNRSFYAGINEATLTQYTPGEADSPNDDEFTGLIPVVPLITNYNFDGRVFIRQTTPLPFTILSTIPHVLTEAG